MIRQVLTLVAVAGVTAIGPAALAQSAGTGASSPFVDPVPLVRFGPPAGWEFAFEDGRLNPNRAERTARGDAQSAQLWTETVPRRARALPAGAGALSQAATPPSGTTRGRYVQVASFRRTENAERAAAQITRAGWPSRIVSSSGYRVVLAGPFETSADRTQALQGTRALGYSDAFVR